MRDKNIAHIHGLEESGGVRALVIELVDGDDLSQRIAKGVIPIDDALPIAKRIADLRHRRSSRTSPRRSDGSPRRRTVFERIVGQHANI